MLYDYYNDTLGICYMGEYNYYEDTAGVSPRWDREWVRVLPVPNRYPQGRELLEIQQTSLSYLKPLNTHSYSVVKGLRATICGNRLSISRGIIWCSIGDDYYISIPSTNIPIPGGASRLGIELVKDTIASGYDPILGGIHPPLWDAPLDRLRVYAKYVWDTPDSLPILTIGRGRVYYYSDTNTNHLDNLIRTYMRELDGDYIASGMGISYRGGWVHVGAGKAWVAGSPIEVQAQSIPYSEGVLQLCSDGTIAIEPSYRSYIPEYSVIVSSTNRPILMGNQYGVVLPPLSMAPYLIPTICMPLAILEANKVRDIAARLPTPEELSILLYNPQVNISLGDINHPLYRVYESGGVISLPRVVQTIPVGRYIPPHTRATLEGNTIRTDWVDSTPNPSTPPPPPPFIYRAGGNRVQAYNLAPGGTYIPNPPPLNVTRGTLTGLSVVADDKGMLEYQSTNTPIDLSGMLPSSTPDLSIGIGQSFQVLSPVMVGAVSLYLRAGYYGVISICQVGVSGTSQSQGQPYGPAIAWAGVSSPSSGWVDISIGPVSLLPGTYALISQSIVGSVLGRRHYLLPTLEGTPETTGSLYMILSQAGSWESLPSQDLVYRVHRAIPTATYRDRSTTIEWGEAFDGYEYRSNYSLPTGTYITCTARAGGAIVGHTFPPTTSLTMDEALFGSDILFPTIGEGEVDIYITSKEGTWVSREELVGTYTGVEVSINAYIPDGSTVTVSINMSNGWHPLDLVDIVGDKYIYMVEGLSPTSSSTDINGVVRQVLRDRLRIRIDLSTTSPEVRPRVWNINRSVR